MLLAMGVLRVGKGRGEELWRRRGISAKLGVSEFGGSCDHTQKRQFSPQPRPWPHLPPPDLLSLFLLRIDELEPSTLLEFPPTPKADYRTAHVSYVKILYTRPHQ